MFHARLTRSKTAALEAAREIMEAEAGARIAFTEISHVKPIESRSGARGCTVKGCFLAPPPFHTSGRTNGRKNIKFEATIWLLEGKEEGEGKDLDNCSTRLTEYMPYAGRVYYPAQLGFFPGDQYEFEADWKDGQVTVKKS